MKTKKRISIILAFVIAISLFGIIGTACTTDDVNEVTSAEITQIVKDEYKKLTGKDLPAVIADNLNEELVGKIAKGTGYQGITTFVCDLIYQNTGIYLNPDYLALAIKAALAINGLVA